MRITLRRVTVLTAVTLTELRALHTHLVALAVLLEAVGLLAVAPLEVLHVVVRDTRLHFRPEGVRVAVQDLFHRHPPLVVVLVIVRTVAAAAVFTAQLQHIGDSLPARQRNSRSTA